MNSIEVFKDWYKRSNPGGSVQMWSDNSGFISPSTQFAWKVWQAALASQAQQTCTTCGGSGYSPPSTDSFLCQACNGKGYPQASERGANHG